MDFNLRNQVAVVTGGSSGIGRAISLAMAKKGANIVINYLNNRPGAEDVKQIIEDMGQKAVIVKADVTQKPDVDNLANCAFANFNHIDILVNCAGGAIRRSIFLNIDEDLWDDTMKLNLKSAYLCSRAFLPNMVANGHGRIINISSVAARLGSPGETVHYAVAKAGINTLTVGLAKEFAAKGILVNAIAPGIVDTLFQQRYSTPERLEATVNKTWLKRIGTPEEVADLAVFLATESGSFITGEIIEISGGRS